MSTNRPSTSEYSTQSTIINNAQTANWPPSDNKKLFRRSIYIWGSVLLVFILVVGGGLAVFLKLNHTKAAPAHSTIVGHAFFVNSGQISPSSNAGIADQLQISLQNIQPPPAGKSYYAWLLSDNTAQALPIPLGTLPVQNGTATLTYKGDSHHTDILANYSRFLITEEDASMPPVNYTLDKSAWIFGAAFSEVPNPADTTEHFSLFDHLRHLLAQDPKLKAAGLTGGLDIWLFRNTEKLLEWAGSARDATDPALMQRQLVRILDYLDGSQFVRTEKIPPGLAAIEVDPTIARVALLEIDPTQSPPGYLKHIGTHLREITQSPGVNADQKALAIRINNAIDNVQFWLEAAHKDAETLLQMPRNQLLKPAATKIFDDLFTQVNNAFVGQTDPNTLQVQEGVAQIHYNIQRLATFAIQPCTASGATCG
jgi:eukaryotic-like serine/threonine-protein kinase